MRQKALPAVTTAQAAALIVVTWLVNMIALVHVKRGVPKGVETAARVVVLIRAYIIAMRLVQMDALRVVAMIVRTAVTAAAQGDVAVLVLGDVAGVVEAVATIVVEHAKAHVEVIVIPHARVHALQVATAVVRLL